MVWKFEGNYTFAHYIFEKCLRFVKTLFLSKSLLNGVKKETQFVKEEYWKVVWFREPVINDSYFLLKSNKQLFK